MVLVIIILLVVMILIFSFIYTKKRKKEIKPKINYIPNTTVNVNDKIYIYINEYRKINGLSPVFPEQTLITTSLDRVKFLKEQTTLSHNGFTSINIGTTFLGEIIAKGFKDELNLFNAYKKSPTHNKILLGKQFTYVGSSTLNGYNCILFAK